MKKIIAMFAFSLSFFYLSIIDNNSLFANKTSPTTLKSFMENYTREAMKYFKKTGDRKYLNQLLPTFPDYAIEEHKEDWKRIVTQALESGKPENSCKSCHDLYKKDYKKNYRKREIVIPESILGLDREIQKSLK